MAATAHFLMPCVVKLELLSSGRSLGSATGFFLKRGQEWTVATNWHVLSGRDLETGQPRHPSGAVPEVCRYRFASIESGGLRWHERDTELCDTARRSAIWLQHPVWGQSVDVAILPLRTAEVGKAKDLLEPGGHDKHMWIDLGGELFIPGFPLGIASAGGLAVWKRASLATSTEFGEGTSAWVLVDTATREGMSGAPCLAISNWRYYRKSPDSPKMTVIENPVAWRLLGVYSGRRSPSDAFEAQLGLVWRDVLVMETLHHGVPATVVLR